MQQNELVLKDEEVIEFGSDRIGKSNRSSLKFILLISGKTTFKDEPRKLMIILSANHGTTNLLISA